MSAKMKDGPIFANAAPDTNRSELDAMVVNIELTLVSIIQGVALAVLTENARVVLAEKQWNACPYVITGLLIILLFWSRSVIHTMTLIRWPLEFVHNFLYIGCTLIQSIAFTRLHDPLRWFIWGAAFSMLVWGLFVFDLRMVRTRKADSRGDGSARLYQIVLRDQWLNIAVLVPAIFVFNAGSAAAIYFYPGFFLERNGHLLLIAGQVFGLLIYQTYVVRGFVKLTPLIAATREEWRSAAATVEQT